MVWMGLAGALPAAAFEQCPQPQFGVSGISIDKTAATAAAAARASTPPRYGRFQVSGTRCNPIQAQDKGRSTALVREPVTPTKAPHTKENKASCHIGLDVAAQPNPSAANKDSRTWDTQGDQPRPSNTSP